MGRHSSAPAQRTLVPLKTVFTKYLLNRGHTRHWDMKSMRYKEFQQANITHRGWYRLGSNKMSVPPSKTSVKSAKTVREVPAGQVTVF